MYGIFQFGLAIAMGLALSNLAAALTPAIERKRRLQQYRDVHTEPAQNFVGRSIVSWGVWPAVKDRKGDSDFFIVYEVDCSACKVAPAALLDILASKLEVYRITPDLALKADHVLVDSRRNLMPPDFYTMGSLALRVNDAGSIVSVIPLGGIGK